MNRLLDDSRTGLIRQILRELCSIRDAEIVLLTRLEQALGSNDPRDSGDPPSALSDAGAGAGQALDRTPALGRAALCSDESAFSAPALPPVSPGASIEAGDPAAPQEVPDWIDLVVNQALQHAFSDGSVPPQGAMEPSNDPDDEDSEDEPAVAEADHLSDPGETQSDSADSNAQPLLLLGNGGDWIGFPWRSVQEVGLAADAAPGEFRTSLADLLAEGQSSGNAEPYRISWRLETGSADLTCAQIGGIVPPSLAAERGVELVIVPEAIGPRTVSLIDFVRDSLTRQCDELDDEPDCGDPAKTIQARASEAVLPAAPFQPVEAALAASAPVSVAAEALAPAGAAQSDLGFPGPASDPAQRGSGFPGPATDPAQRGSGSPGPASDPAQRPSGPERIGIRPSAPERIGSHPSAPDPTGIRPSATAPCALLAVRNLPARVAIGRFLRSGGWHVIEAVDFHDVPARLRRHPVDAVFAEVPESPRVEPLIALRRAGESGAVIVGISSRFRAVGADPLRSLGDVPRLLYPFQEVDLEKVLAVVRQAHRS